MKLENEFSVAVPIDRAWEVLTDIPLIAPCLPGAKLTGQEGDEYSGTVKIKVGPVTAEYSGTALFVERDEETHHVEISAKGRDSRGSGNASAVITADMTEDATADGDSTTVSISTDLKISGKVAQFGKGMIAEVSGKLIDQFVDCIEQHLAQDDAATGDDASTPEIATAAGAPSANSVAPTAEPAPESDDALDLMALAGSSVYKRLVPIIGLVVTLVLIRMLLKRR